MSGPDITGRRGRGLAVGLALTVVLTACGNEGGSAGQDVADSAGATAPEEWSPSRWTPPVAIQPVLTAEAEKEAAYRSGLERRAQTLRITDPPRVQRRVKRPGFRSDPNEGESEHAQEVQPRAA